MKDAVLCVGEVLWDSMPAGLFLGGAPFNVACHLSRLGQPVTFVSRVGEDVLGAEAVRRVRLVGIDSGTVQVDPALPTGFVKVEVDAEGIPEYEIVRPAAWDAIALDPDLHDAAAAARAVVFGSLAQRHATSRRTVQELASIGGASVFDVNLRPPFVEPALVRASLEAADFVKLNEDELQEMARWFALPASPEAAVRALADAFGCRLVCVTRGGAGAALWHEGRWREHPGYPVTVADTVGAGDAFLAALLASVLEGSSDEVALDRACRLGAFVASRPGATPDYEVGTLAEIAALSH
ncbi:MAG: carbohydrate kinase [Rhodothermales bacterium]|nr:carbohydrate kinase [Rhodothermales bacterium]